MHPFHVLTALLSLAVLHLAVASPLTTRQNTGCYCGTLTGTSCGSRTSSGLSLSGDCAANVLYTCTERFGNAEVDESCLICDAGGQDGYDSCALGLGVGGGGVSL